ncbi:hypothetical protein V5O48_005558 [Marasmius crinis-equi]|uniref:Uncharacterized protein n=1 Tax=Marasmius crinis-equi TaxID=585013 RepID=A0ABR3FMC2_9AGAR
MAVYLLADLTLSVLAGLVATVVFCNGAPPHLDSRSNPLASAVNPTAKLFITSCIPDADGIEPESPSTVIQRLHSEDRDEGLLEQGSSLQDSFRNEKLEWEKTQYKLDKEMNELRCLVRSWADIESRYERLEKGISGLQLDMGFGVEERDNDTEFLDCVDEVSEGLPGYEEMDDPGSGQSPQFVEAVSKPPNSEVLQPTIELNIALNDCIPCEFLNAIVAVAANETLSTVRSRKDVAQEKLNINVNVTINYLTEAPTKYASPGNALHANIPVVLDGSTYFRGTKEPR